MSPGGGATLNPAEQDLPPNPQHPPSLAGWGLREGSRSIPAFQSLLSALIHLMNYRLKQLRAEGGAGSEEGDLAYN